MLKYHIYAMIQITMAIAREVASVTRLGIEVNLQHLFLNISNPFSVVASSQFLGSLSSMSCGYKHSEKIWVQEFLSNSLGKCWNIESK